MSLVSLPIDEVLPDLFDALREHRVAVLQAPPGAGKSTRVPVALLDSGLVDADQKIVVLEPRRVAARAVATRMASERGQRVGDEIGYAVRFDRKVGPSTRVEVVTEGLLLRRLHEDPLIEEIGCVVLDEFHERSVNVDLALAMLAEIRQVREDLLVVVMSATLQTAQLADYLDAPVVTSEGRTFPVSIEHAPAGEDLIAAIDAQLQRTFQDPEEQDVLVFLPGARSIHALIDRVEGWARQQGIAALPLYGALSLDEQIRAIEPGSRRRVIAATNIAETSLTVEGVTTVIDSGLVKMSQVDPSSGLNKLVEQRIALDSAKQRAGRAGRVRPGRAVRMWKKLDEEFMSAATSPEIARADVTAAILDVISWTGAAPEAFDWFEAPGKPSLSTAVELLRALGVLPARGYQLTGDGKKIAKLPAHPRLGRILLDGARAGVLDEVAAACALLSEGDCFESVSRGAAPERCDVWPRARLIAAGRIHAGRVEGYGLRAGAGAVKRIRRVAAQLGRAAPETSGQCDSPLEAFQRALLAGYPDRVCLARARDGRQRDLIMTGGQPVTLDRSSRVREHDVLVAASLFGARNVRADATGVTERGIVRLASGVEMAWVQEMFPAKFTRQVEVEFDRGKQRVRAMRVERFAGLLLGREPASVKEHADPGDVAKILARYASQDLPRAFGLDADGVQLLERLAFLRRELPELELPDLRPQVAEGARGERGVELLEQWCWGHRSFAELKKVSVAGMLRGALTREQYKLLEDEAPARVQVPSGSNIRLDYSDASGPPVLAVRIQEVFGMQRSPRLARGKVAVLMHLLAPNYRPAQVTLDLESFWENTYPQVRKELRARYSKHPWPEDPLSARAIRK